MTKTKKQFFYIMFSFLTVISIMYFTKLNASAAPDGAQITRVRVNGRQVLDGDVFTYNGDTYVPMFRFSAWLGNFKYSYDYKTKTARIDGENLIIKATADKLYIEANGRYFYTSGKVMLYNGEMYLPIRPIVKALNSYIYFDDATNQYVVSSGDSRLLKSGDSFYRDDEVLWLARIIHAESQGEPFKGKMAVGNVILNRVRSTQFPNTIYSVIFDKKYGVQFTPSINGAIYNTPNAESIIAAKVCLEGYSLSNNILYFVNPKLAPNSWASKNRPYAFTIQNHSFFN